MTFADPFHPGEAALQRATGVRARIAEIGGKLVRDRMPDQHRELFEKLPTLFVGTLDDDGQPWATIVHGAPGFVRTPDATTLVVRARVPADDPARAGLRPGAAVGALGLEPHTRRRNRANGAVTAAEDDAFAIHVHQSFGNCPKYIHAREPAARPGRSPAEATREGPHLGPEARALVAQSDTFFLATSSSGRLTEAVLSTTAGAGVDVSHRGGPAGFVEIERGPAADVLLVPDYTGNFMFNTLGNLLVWRRAGLLFVDFELGHVLQLAADATLRTDDEVLSRFPDADRVLSLVVRGGWLRRSAVPLVWTPPEAPPQLR